MTTTADEIGHTLAVVAAALREGDRVALSGTVQGVGLASAARARIAAVGANLTGVVTALMATHDALDPGDPTRHGWLLEAVKARCEQADFPSVVKARARCAALCHEALERSDLLRGRGARVPG